MSHVKQYLGYAGLFGVACVAAGGILALIQGQVSTYAAAIMIVGLLAVLVYVLLDFKNIQSKLSSRSVKYGSNMAAMIIIVLGIVTLVEAISSRHSLRLDLTANKRFTLSEQTHNILNSLEKDVNVVAFFSQDQGGRDALENLLQQYRHISPRVSYEFIDPDKNPGQAKKYEIKQYGTIVLETDEKQEKVMEPTEEALTNGLIKVIKEGKKVVYFLTGHGEHDLEDTGEQGYAQAKNAIEDEHYEVKSLLLMQESAVPEDAALLVIAGPQKGLLPAEIESIRNYLQQGGNALMLFDPDQAPEMTAFMQEYGILLGNNIIVDTLSRVFGASYDMPVASQYGNHPITENFNIATFFPLARSIQIAEEKPQGVSAQPLLSTGQQSWAETSQEELLAGEVKFDPNQDLQGPVPLAAVVNIQSSDQDAESKPREARLVVFGDSDFAGNSYLGLSGNSDLFLNTISWLAEEEDLIAIRAKDPETAPLLLTAAQGRFAFFLSIVALPLVVIVTGVSVFVRRRRSTR